MNLKTLSALLASTVIMAATGSGPARAAAEPCNSIGKAKFACVTENSEDVVAMPGSDWLVISGALRAVNVKDNTEVSLFPTAEKWDKTLYGACPGPLTGKEVEEKRVHAHGINIRPGKNGIHIIYDVHHGQRESIEVFEINATGKTPTSTWVGCVLAPPDAGFNGLAVLPGNGLAVTSFTRRSAGGFRGEKGKNIRARLTAGEDVSEIWEWHPGKDWFIIPGSQGPGLNGVEASADGKYLYASGWGNGQIIRYTRGQTPPERKVIATVNFHPDNMRWQPDGTLVTAGQTGTVDEVLDECLSNGRCTKTGSSGAIIDLNTGKVREVFTNYPSNGDFDLATAGVIVKDELWVGAIGRGKRLARFPLK